MTASFCILLLCAASAVATAPAPLSEETAPLNPRVVKDAADEAAAVEALAHHLSRGGPLDEGELPTNWPV